MFFPDDAVRVAALSEYVDRWVSDRLSTPTGGGKHDHRNHSLSDASRTLAPRADRRRDRRQLRHRARNGGRARAEGAKLILTGRNAERLRHAALELDALTSAAFDATDLDRSSGSSTRCRHRSTT